MSDALTIGKLAEQAGVNLDTIRYYERRGLLPKPDRTGAGYRLFDEGDLRRVRFIKRAQALGFTLTEIRGLLDLRMKPGTTCGEIRGQATEKIGEVREKIAQLKKIEKALTKLANQCRGKGPVSECPILDHLEPEDK